MDATHELSVLEAILLGQRAIVSTYIQMASEVSAGNHPHDRSPKTESTAEIRMIPWHEEDAVQYANGESAKRERRVGADCNAKRKADALWHRRLTRL